ncbi:acyl-CoA dehydrogenase family protein [Sphingorhabdus contaminans]|uniref:Acyl-CoA dehydrogenase n=1 Tax=Sphingorhabdus contaminans TaxID=1343899 RepID=A0A553WCC9_9SPHN|nr:acyl-CoA dehydrogenase family protein [Sphingorhabdus contaminans]TSB02334.1 acyl-CoA dehydrogenase [Sphingorhabdus contaminans]
MSDTIDLDFLDESFAEMLSSEWPRERSVAHAQSGNLIAADLWSQMAGLGWTALNVPEEFGGLGLGIEATSRLHAALGAVSAPVPMLGTTMAAALIAHAGSDRQRKAWLPALADGSMRFGFAQPSGAQLTIENSSVSGIAADILDAPSATHFVLNGRREGKRSWIVLAADSPGLSVEVHPLNDTSRTLGSVNFSQVTLAEDAIISAPDCQRVVDLLEHWSCIALASDSLGIGEAVLNLTIEYLNVREQFGKVIGSFQALKHRVADHKTALVGAREFLAHVASLDPGDPAGLIEALSSKAHITRVAAEVARDCIQLHGGVGFTAEFQPHVFLKRAKLNEALYLTRNEALDRVADLLEAA